MFKTSMGAVALALALGMAQPAAAGDGALAGGLIGAGVGAIIGGAATGKAGGAAVGAVVGGATGAIIGNQVEKSNRRVTRAGCYNVTNRNGRLLYTSYGEPRVNCYDRYGNLVSRN